MTNKSNSFIENKIQLIQYFKDGIKKDTDLRIGVEHEKFLFNRTDLKRINYDQIKKIFEILKEKGWEPQLEGDKLIGLKSCLLYTSPSPRDLWISRMPSSA